MYSSPVLGRASLIGSQTQGISVLHNRVRRHREDGARDSLSASERGASFWNTGTPVGARHTRGSALAGGKGGGVERKHRRQPHSRLLPGDIRLS